MEEKEEITLNRLGTQPVGKLMLSLGIPMIISMILQAVYTSLTAHSYQIWQKTAKRLLML